MFVIFCDVDFASFYMPIFRLKFHDFNVCLPQLLVIIIQLWALSICQGQKPNEAPKQLKPQKLSFIVSASEMGDKSNHTTMLLAQLGKFT